MFLAKLKLHQSFLPEILYFFCPVFKSTFDFYFRSILKIEARSEWRNLLSFSLKKFWHYNFTNFFRPSSFFHQFICAVYWKKKIHYPSCNLNFFLCSCLIQSVKCFKIFLMYRYSAEVMVLKLDGSPENGAHIWKKTGIPIC